MDLIDRENLVCTYCGEKPVVGVTFAIDAEIADGETVSRELVQSSIIATSRTFADPSGEFEMMLDWD